MIFIFLLNSLQGFQSIWFEAYFLQLFLSLVCAIMDRTLPRLVYCVVVFINTVAVVLIAGT